MSSQFFSPLYDDQTECTTHSRIRNICEVCVRAYSKTVSVVSIALLSFFVSRKRLKHYMLLLCYFDLTEILDEKN